MAQARSSVSFPALGGIAVVAVSEPAQLELAVADVEETVEAFDLACSRFRDDSELRAVNEATGRTTPVSPLLLEAIAAGVRAAALTDGDVDPTVGRALVALGYDRDFAALDGAPRSVSIAAVPGWRSVAVDHRRGTVRLAAGVQLDLGATAKALAADRAAQRASAAAGCGVLVSLSGDIATAGLAPPGGWQVRVAEDHRAGPEAPGQSLTLSSGGLATSSTTVRRWSTDSGSAHHVVDPATGWSAREVWRTVSVAAASCLDANVATTAAIVRGERAVGWLESLTLPSRLVALDGSVTHLAGWPADGDDLASPGENVPPPRPEVPA